MPHARQNWLGLVLIVLFLGVTYWIPNNLYQRLPRLEDEVAELWQARAFASGHLAVASPPAAEAFAVPFVLDYHGLRFSKYPPGHAALLALGVLIGEPWIVNPLLMALGLATLYRLAQEIAGRWIALLTLLLAATSPMLLMLSASLMPHAASILTSTVYLLSVFRLQRAPPPPRTHTHLHARALAGLALGLTFVIRPFTALGLAIPLVFITLREFLRAPRATLTRYRPLALTFALASAPLFIYNYLLTGQLRLSLYELWWPYDRPGFGPTVGPHGYYLAEVLKNLWLGLWSLNYDLLGWLFLSLLPVLAGLLLKPRAKHEWHLAAYPAVLFLGYLAFFHQSRLYGPRYYSEAVAPLMLLAAMGVQKTAARLRAVIRFLPAVLLTVLIASNLLYFTPARFKLLQHLYEDQPAWGVLDGSVVEAVRAAGLHRAIVFAFSDNWPGAAAGLLNNSVGLGDDVLFARYLGPESFDEVRAAYPARALYFWRDGALTPATLPPPEWAPQCPTVCPPG